MAQASPFELLYGSIALGGPVAPLAVGPSTAFVPLSHPPPVGTEVVAVANGLRFPAVVVRVIEDVKGRDRAPGVWLRVADLPAHQAAAWSEWVTGADPDLSPVPAIRNPDEGRARKGDSRHPPIDDGKQTQLMSVEEIRAAVAERAAEQAAEVAAERSTSSDGVPAAAADPSLTQPIGSGLRDDDGGKSRKKRRRRR